MKKKRKQNSSSIMLRSFIWVITLIMLISSLAMVVSIGNQLLEMTRENSDGIIDSLEETIIDDDGDWNKWVLNNTLDTSTSYVHVVNQRGDAKRENYYSPGTKKLLSTQKTKVPLIKNLYYRQGRGFYYYSEGRAKGIDYKLWVNLDEQIEILERAVAVTLVILLLTLIISPLYINVIAERITNSLKKLTNSAEKATTTSTEQNATLLVPDSPTEVTNLANSFNRLLAQVYKQNEKDKLFVSNAAHELRTPIAAIRSHAQLIQRRGHEHPEVIDKSIQYINDESYQMQALVDELLTLSRAGRVELEMMPVNLAKLVQTVVTKLDSVTTQSIDIQASAGASVVANAESLQQILTNIITNASKYSPSDSQIKIKIVDGNQPVISIYDTGSGISQEDKEHIFEQFYRSPEVRGTIQGTGLGLSIVKQLAELNHITIEFADNVPRGTIVKLIFNQAPENN
ncbi:sensor histidine kinase [Paucilactobacillus nenjiangensis]|uniref:sensor histidine kinase n=1 Tax=Paucilactobacillus nenjiangensis TaxID=1296540 RepID=UPI0010F81FE4|nr:HAMP domain-containing sensor histidine kinase [Paucilactobacillus nenjiangensis]